MYTVEISIEHSNFPDYMHLANTIYFIESRKRGKII